MKDPFEADITLAGDFLGLPHLRGVIPDTHFKTRDRMGRMLVFMGQGIGG
jgi:cyanophycinase